MQIELIDDPNAFFALREEWDDLVAASDGASVFQTWEWLYTWWTHLGGRRRLHLLAARDGGELLALAPLALRPGLPVVLPPRLELLGTGTVGSDYLDVIVRRGADGAALEALAAHVESAGVGLDLRQLRADGSCAARLASLLAGRGWRLTRKQTDVCPLVRLAGHTWDSFLATLGPAHRANVRRRLRKLADLGDVQLEEVRDEEQRPAVLADLLRLHERRWKTRGGSDAFDAPAVVRFHEAVTRLALARGWLRLYALRIDGSVVAALYGLRYGETFSFYQSGFDPDRAPASVGLVLLAATLQRAIAEGAAEYDLLHGDEAYKFLWAREVRALARLEADPPGLAAAARRAVVQVHRAARRAARRLLPAPLVTRLSALRRQGLRTLHVASPR